jgi:alcohol dehydrogenase
VTPFETHVRTRIVFGAGSLARLGEVARELGFRRTLLVTDAGLIRAGHARTAERLLEHATVFSAFDANPDSDMVERGRAFAAEHEADSIVGLGGGSAMDCAKAINFLVTNGGRIQDYHGYGKAVRPMLPMIGIPTTTGTGSEAQSYALISDARTHRKMACGDPQAAFRVAILDPALAASQPAGVRAQAGYDAISHAVETWVTTKRNAFSDSFSREAFRLLNENFEATISHPDDVERAGAMLLGAHFAGVAIEHSMLGATHACANPLTANYGTAHGAAIAALLPAVVEWNADPRYRQLHDRDLSSRLSELRSAAGLPGNLRAAGARESDLPRLADEAAEQWTGRFNPRPFDAAAALEVYRCAW